MRNGRHPPTATRGNDRDQPPSQLHAASERHSDVQIEKRTLDYHDYRSGEPPECASLPVLKLSKGMKYLPVLDPFPKGTRRSQKKRTQGPIFGSPAAGTPVRRGGALAHRPATAGPPGATPNRRAGCFIGRGCSNPPGSNCFPTRFYNIVFLTIRGVLGL